MNLSSRLSSFLGASLLFVACSAPRTAQDVDVVFLGDSITEGYALQKPTPHAAPDVCSGSLRELLAGRLVHMSNQGHSGHTTVDFLPDGDDCRKAIAAAHELQSAHPGELVFSIMLGTNDSANSGPNGSPVDGASYQRNLGALLDRLFVEFPHTRVFVHHPIWYSPNTHNGADYEGEPAASRLRSYFGAIAAVAAEQRARGRDVRVGDTEAYGHFEKAHEQECDAEQGHNGVFYLHPNAAGAASLGRYWAKAIAAGLGGS